MQFSLPSTEKIQDRLNADRRLTAALTGAFIGACAVILGVLLAVGGPLLALGAFLGIGAGLYILTDMMAGMYMMLIVVGLLPYGTLPLRVAVTPTFLDVALGSFLLVYIFQWMTGRRSNFRLVPAQILIVAFVIFLLFSFVAGLANANVTTSILRKFTEMLMSIILAIVLVDAMRDIRTVQRIVLALILIGALEGAIGVVLVRINTGTANQALNALSRFGYPTGDVLRYVNDDPSQAARAIGTWIDPNSYSFFLMLVCVVGTTQMLSEKPVIGKRWLFLLFIPTFAALMLTRSRQAQVAYAVAVLMIAILRYRWLLLIIPIAVIGLALLPGANDDIQRFIQGINAQDLSTQMRLGEYKDALTLISRYPLIGVGFTGTPDRDIYLGVANVYLTIAGNTGLIGLMIFLITMLEVFRYGFRRWKALIAGPPELFTLWLGFTTALAASLFQGLFDHFFFHVEFQGAVMLFWMFIGLTLASARMSDDQSVEVEK